MTVNELLVIAIDYYDTVSVDEVVRCINNVVRDINGLFRGIHKTVIAVNAGTATTGYARTNEKLTLSGLEKTILRIMVEDYICTEVKTFDKCGDEDYAITRTAHNTILFNYLPDDPTITIEGLFAMPKIATKTDIVEIPEIWDSILTNGLLHYISMFPRHRVREADGFADIYYESLRNMAENTNVSILNDYSAWDYANARKV